jgi:hypothetical protein
MSAAQQDMLLERERQKLQRRAQGDVIRNLRFRDARWRTIGIDEQALREQVNEKERWKNSEKEASKLERQRYEEYDRILQAAADEEAYLRRLQNDELKRSWTNQIANREPEVQNEPISFAIGSDDTLRSNREKEKKAQMMRWSQEQTEEKVRRRVRDKEEDVSYADMLKAMDEIRGRAEDEEARLRNEMIARVRDENKKLAEEQRLRKLKDRDPYIGADAMNNSLPLTTGYGGKDAFRGFDEDRKRAILKENEKLVAFKKTMKDRERELDAAWHEEQLLAVQAMNAAEIEERQLRELLKLRQRDMLRDHIAETRRREGQDKADRNEPIGDGFFDGFGVNWR